MGGQELLLVKKPELYEEIERTIIDTDIPDVSKISEEEGKKGQLVWSGTDFNGPLKTAFKAIGWNRLRLNLPEGKYIECDFNKERVGLEVQFGKYFSVDTDFSKFEIFYHQNMIDLCVEVVPSLDLRNKMYSGVANIGQVITRIQAKGRNNPAVPIWIIGVNVED